MQQPIDQRHVFDDEVFAYRVAKDGKVFIAWHGKQVMIVKGDTARTFPRRIDGLGHLDAQLLVAKLIGNFKRGNER